MLFGRGGCGGRHAMLALAMLVAHGARALAQEEVRVAVTGGLATDQRGVQASAVTLAPGVSFTTRRGSRFSIAGDLTQYGGEAWSLGGGLSGFHRSALGGPFAFSLEGSAAGSRLGVAGTSASFSTLEVLPALGLEVRALTLSVGARAVTGQMSQTGTPQAVPGPGGGPNTVRKTQNGAGPVFDASLMSVPSPGDALRLDAHEERLLVSGVLVTDLSMAVTVVNTVSTFAGTLGRRQASDERGSYGGVALSFIIAPYATLDAAAGRYLRDRFTGALAGSYVRAGFTFGAAPAMPPVRAAPAGRRP